MSRCFSAQASISGQSLTAREVDRRARAHQEAHAREFPRFACEHERGLGWIRSHRRRADQSPRALDQQPHDLNVAAAGRHLQRCETVLVRLVD